MAILAAPGCNGDELMAVKNALTEAGATGEVVSKKGGKVRAAGGQIIAVDKTFLTAASVMYDAVYVPGGRASIDTLRAQGDAIHFINEAFRHCKPLGATSEGIELIKQSDLGKLVLAGGGDPSVNNLVNDRGVVTAGTASPGFIKQLTDAIAQHRHWQRGAKEQVPA